jgi:ribosome recycling factor
MVVKTFDDLMKKYQEKIDRLFADKEKDILTV